MTANKQYALTADFKRWFNDYLTQAYGAADLPKP